jgi:hypothetical protein
MQHTQPQQNLLQNPFQLLTDTLLPLNPLIPVPLEQINSAISNDEFTVKVVSEGSFFFGEFGGNFFLKREVKQEFQYRIHMTSHKKKIHKGERKRKKKGHHSLTFIIISAAIQH